jgi:hypothetical protein
MKHLKNFSQIFESLEDRKIFTPEEIKSLPGYKELIEDYGYKDTTTPVIAKSGNLRLEHSDLSNEYTIYSNGYIRQQPGPYPMWWNSQIIKKGTPSVLVRPDGTSTNDAIFGGEIKNLEDYEIKFRYLKDYLIKKNLKDTKGLAKEITGKNLNSNEISDIINKKIEDDPTSISTDVLKKMVKIGKLIPSEFTKTIMGVGDFGLFG